MKDFGEMGAHQGGNWPLSAESIKRKFGKPKRGHDQNDGEYFETIRAASHQMIEFALEHYLKQVAHESYLCLNHIFSADNSGDNDWESLKKRATLKLDPVTQAQWDKMNALERTNLINAKKRHLDAERTYLQCQAGITLITHLLWHVDLFVEYARRRTKHEEESNAEKGRRIYLEFKSLTTAQPEGRGLSSKRAYKVLEKDYGVSVSRLEQIVALQRQEVDGLPPRAPGRPKTKKEAS
jgi:hypothetical protein